MPVNMANILDRYDYAMGQVGVFGSLLINTGPDQWQTHGGIRMIFRKFTPAELVSPVDQATMVVMILAVDMPAGITKLKTRDRIRTDEGKEFTIKKADFNTREVQGTTMMIEAAVRG
jgi:hypothetical protein